MQIIQVFRDFSWVLLNGCVDALLICLAGWWLKESVRAYVEYVCEKDE